MASKFGSQCIAVLRNLNLELKGCWSSLRRIGNLSNQIKVSISLSLIVLLITVSYLLSSHTGEKELEDILYCHAIETDQKLPDISDNAPLNVTKRNIFFLETSCNSHKEGKLTINARQACAVESAARLNPNMDVYLLFASPGIIKDEDSESDRILRVLKLYPNIKILHFNIKRFVQNSPVENLWTTGKIRVSLFPMAHTSDILRLLALWKYGGIYLDLDVIVTKNLEDLPDNFGGAESDVLVANGVIGFGKDGKGKEYINECINDISQNFDGQQWSFNGPQLLTRNIFSHCPQFDWYTIIRFGRCEEFKIFPPSAFYMLHYTQWRLFFDENLGNILVPLIEKQSYLTHVWNKLSFRQNISKTDTNVPYLKLATKYCPGVVRALDKYF
ncbi:unnamed protein product [Ceutorhynchus assimilis]|uniref:Alpha 1,4-glycosyltransferase domain-containing protein n=1 Tax=Ceutorhynchus assimilis TaxID=467358 RepID=A0A9N9MH04_9CUCU|nr:unnamed protein product [Ceutorhynchus assimilis]